MGGGSAARTEGWFRVTASEDVPRGAVRTVRLSGRDLVLFRTSQGALAASDPICPHLGAHLGHGGRVVDDALRCPFHGLRFGIDGRCTGTEHCESPPSRARLGVYPVRDFHGQIVVFDAAQPSAPSFPLPELASEHVSTPRYVKLLLEATIRDLAENGIDLGHFGSVHRYSNVRDIAIRYDGPRIHSRFRFDRANPFIPKLGHVTSVFDTILHGLGCSITELHVESFDLRLRLLLFATQLEPGRAEFTVGLAAHLPPALAQLPRAVADAAVEPMIRTFQRYVVADISQDRAIWAHREDLASPALAREDAEIGRFRRWAAQFRERGDA